MTYIGEKCTSMTEDHFEILRRDAEGTKYDGTLKRRQDSAAPTGWRVEEPWFENVKSSREAYQDGERKAKEAGVVLVAKRAGLAERTILWHPEGWEPKKE